MTADRLAPVLIALTGIAALAAALLLQFGFDLRPCILCKIERAPYVVAVLASAVVLARARGGRALTGFCAAVFAVGAAVAFYHVGVEGHWWGSMVCGSVSDAPMTLADLRRAL
ncbi:MAG: disulfide bond formation protein B, partial [Alphaproteobacteria bacterium]|nr:disulfide bond formation protein B [Alphaproteobacteria bacterium]